MFYHSKYFLCLFFFFALYVDVTTVLLVDNHGRQSLGRFLNVKPAVGLLTSTARTFIQEGVTTEYATQVLGTTLDNGRLYAHLLTKSSRVLYDKDQPQPTRTYQDTKWNIDNNFINKNLHNFVKNTDDFISPNRADAFLVFPTTKPTNPFPTENKKESIEIKESTESKEELLNSAQTSNARVRYQEPLKEKYSQSFSTSSSNNVKVFKVNPVARNINLENVQVKSQSTENDVASNGELPRKYDALEPSKVQPRTNLPTFTVRNDFSPSGFSFLGDFPDFEATERSKPTTPVDRKGKLLFRGGLPIKNDFRDLQTVTYRGFADFTTTVGDTVIIFSPHTATSKLNLGGGHITSITGAATIKPTSVVPGVATSVKTFLSHEPPMQTETVHGHKFKMQTSLPTMVIDSFNRQRESKQKKIQEEHEDVEAKSAVLAHEQNVNKYDTSFAEPAETTTEKTQELPQFIVPGIETLSTTRDVIQPSETSSATIMLSTPSDEQIKQIFALLAAKEQANKQATEPLPSSVPDNSQNVALLNTESETKVLGGATTIFFEDDAFLPTDTFGNIASTLTTQPTTNPPTTIEEETEGLSTMPFDTTEKITEKTTTEREPTTLNEITTSDETVSTVPMEETTPENKPVTENIDVQENDVEASCTEDRIVPTTIYKTLTYLTTFFIPTDATTTTSIKSNVVVSTEIGLSTEPCTAENISPSNTISPITINPSEIQEPTTIKNFETTTLEEKETTLLDTTTERRETTTTEKLTTRPKVFTTTTERETTTELETTTDQETTFFNTENTTPYETTPSEITTERRHVTESESDPVETTTDSGEEVEIIYKTLYTTYTYLTTFFQESTSSVSSRKVVETNVITSTLEPGTAVTDPAVAGLFARDDTLINPELKSKPATFEDLADIQPTNIAELPTVTDINNNVQATPVLDEKLLQTTNAIKTYYTTYTYFTTIFVDGETEISSRTEVYTNYVTPSAIQPTETVDVQNTLLPEELLIKARFGSNQVEAPIADVDDVNRQVQMSLKVTPSNVYNSTISRQRTQIIEEVTDLYEKDLDNLDNNILVTSKTNLEPSYSTLIRSKPVDNIATKYLDLSTLSENDYEIMVTDVRSSTSVGERRILDNVDKRNILDDQIVAESNNDSEIIPSPTLLLQTSYTTFTYFTTMYHGTTSSNVVSRLETITNVVTETLTPSQTINPIEATLPITYFTTFTYWTTLYKEGSTTITSREETVSNIVTPTLEGVPTVSITPTQSAEIEPTATATDDLTTFYTTYTYFTTSYIGNSTVLNSRLETVTNVVNNTNLPTIVTPEPATTKQNLIPDEKTKTAPNLFPTGLISTEISSIVNDATTTLYSTDVFGTYIDGLYAKVLESTTKIVTETIAPTSVAPTPLQPTGVVSLNEGKIVDAEGVSTLFYTTQAIGTYIENLYAQVITSTSSLRVDEERKSALPTDLDPVALAHRTGLVRLIEGSIVQNKTTTVYQSKVLGTVIDGRYAQIIESTSSFIVEKTTAPSIAPTATLAPGQIAATATPISPSPVVIEGSLNEDSTKNEDDNTTGEEDDEEGEEDEDGRVKSRLTFQTKKRTFTPVIRPFVSRNRPTFAPKRKGSGASAATITRSDLTPTITATPALKAESTRGRFSGNRKSSGISVSATPSGSRRFGNRGRATSSSTSSFRGRTSARVQPTATGFGGSRRGGFRSSSAPARASSNIFASSSRFRGNIRPSLSSNFNRGPASVTPQPSANDEGNDLTTLVTDEPTDSTDTDSDTTLPLSTTESTLRRSQNPLLRFRRPPLSRPAVAPTTPRTATTRRNGNLRQKTTTTTTPKPRTRGNPRTNPVAALQNRQRGGNGLFPPRNLFKPTVPTTEAPEEDEEDTLDEGEDLDVEPEEDTEFEGTNTNSQTEKAPVIESRKGRAYSPVQVKPFVSFRRRTKRQTSPYSRFRRPTGRTTSTSTEEPTTEAVKSSRTSKQTRFRPRSGQTTSQPTTSSPKRLSPTRSSSGRSQFTLREKDSTTSRSNFKRPTSSSRRTTTASRPKAPRLRSGNSRTEEPSNYQRTTSRSQQARRRSSISRSRQRNDNLDNYVVPTFDGTITVTHQIPTEVTIPVVNGKITEYKNIVTAKLSTEVLGPQQYSTKYNDFGKEITFLLAESTGIAGNGATEITQFILNETPTSSVIFTPTYIRGRKTSFSHIVPSTAYGVEQVVQTIQPQLAAQAPLANILLSQLLLGNLGIPQQNPLLALQNQNQANPTPTTEFKTRTTTYVTTVTDATSTVIPLTFRGKEILTTIIDSSTNVITATEFLTDTIVVTPTATNNNAQLNSLLLPLLLQQQQQQVQQPLGQINPLLQQQQLQQPFGLTDLTTPLTYFKDNISAANDVQEKEEESNEQLISEEAIEEQPPRKKNSRKKSRTHKPVEIAPPPKETSVITLYVSGRRPGEFSTVLSTVTLGEENNRRKREIGEYVEVKPSRAIYEISSTEALDKFIMPAMSDSIESSQAGSETESLESILGDVSKYIDASEPIDKDTKYVRSEASIAEDKIVSGNFLL